MNFTKTVMNFMFFVYIDKSAIKNKEKLTIPLFLNFAFKIYILFFIIPNV